MKRIGLMGVLATAFIAFASPAFCNVEPAAGWHTFTNLKRYNQQTGKWESLPDADVFIWDFDGDGCRELYYNGKHYEWDPFFGEFRCDSDNSVFEFYVPYGTQPPFTDGWFYYYNPPSDEQGDFHKCHDPI